MTPALSLAFLGLGDAHDTVLARERKLWMTLEQAVRDVSGPAYHGNRGFDRDPVVFLAPFAQMYWKAPTFSQERTQILDVLISGGELGGIYVMPWPQRFPDWTGTYRPTALPDAAALRNVRDPLETMVFANICFSVLQTI